MSKNNATAFPLLCAALGWTEGFEANEEGVHMSAEDIAKLEEKFSNMATSVDQLNTSVQTLTEAINTAAAALETANKTINSLTIQRDALEEKVVAMGGQRAHNGSAPGADATNETAPAAPKKSKYIPDGTEKIAEKYGMKLDCFD